MKTRRLEPERRWENRPLVREADSDLLRRLLRMTFAVMVAVSPIGLYLWMMNQSLDLAQQSTQQLERLESLHQEARSLTADLAELESPDRIEAWARDRRGLSQAEPQRIVVLDASPASTDPVIAQAPGAR